MTSRDSYRRPVSSEAALAELRRVAGSQLDPLVVDAFETMILEQRRGVRHTDEADFEPELASTSGWPITRGPASRPPRSLDLCSIQPGAIRPKT